MEYLMPSEIARLVLGYLKSAGCHSAWEAFLRESPDLKEYAEYVRRGREYPTNIAGKNLIQLLDAGFQFTQTQGPGSTSGETVPNLQQISAQLTTLLAQLQSAWGGNNGGNHNGQPSPRPQGATPSSAASGARSSSPSTLPQPRYGADTEPLQPARVSTAAPGGFSQTPRPSHSQPNGNTLSYHVHTPLPPYPLLPPSIASMLKHKPLEKADSAARFEPPEKDLGAFGPHPLDPKASASVSSYSGPPHLAAPHLAAYSDCYLAYINSLPRQMYARNPFMGDEEPVRDSGIDLRKRPAEKDDQSLAAAQASPARSNKACQGSWGQDDVPLPDNERSNASCDQHNSVPTEKIVASAVVEPSSEGFEVSEAVVETRTEASEEIDVDGSSRGPSPGGEEQGAAVLPCQHSTMVVRSVAPSPVTAVPSTSAASSPVLTIASSVEQTPDHAGSQSPVAMETPENVGPPPPLPQRFPAPDSPRGILSQERSLQPSLSTPVKEIRFDISRFYSPRRKSLIPRRRLLSGPSPSSKQAASSGEASSSFPEEPKEALVLLDELLQNHPFVEKLVENINQAVVGPEGSEAGVSASARLEPIPEETTISTRDMLTSQDGSVSDTLIKDILARTESDPVFEEVLAQLCEKLDTTSEVHGVLVTPKSKSCSKSSRPQGGGNASPPRTPRQSQQPISLSTTPQLINMLEPPATPGCRAPQTPRRSPRLNTPRTQLQWRSPSPPKTSPSKVGAKTQCRTSPIKQGKPVENSASQPLSPPRSAPKQASPFKTPTSRSVFSMPVGVPLKALLKTPSRPPESTGVAPVPTNPAVQVVSKAMEDGQTVTCISIPDLPQPEGSPARCTTLADVINSILSPEHRKALCQADSVATLAVSQPVPQADGSIVVGPQVSQVVLCTGSNTDLRIPGQAPTLVTTAATSAVPSLVYPGMVLSSPFNIVVASPAAVAKRQLQPVASSSNGNTGQAQSSKPIAKKRLPLLQPKSPLPTEPSPPAAFKRLEKPRFSAVMSARLRGKKLTKTLMKEVESSLESREGLSRSSAAAERSKPTNQGSPTASLQFLSPSSTSGSGSSVQRVVTSGPVTPTTASASSRTNHELSPQLKSLVSRASKCATSRNHVRALDFGGCLSEAGARGSGSQAGSGDQTAIIESIRTSLAGAMNKALRNGTPGATTTGRDSANQKRKAGASNAGKAKKARSEDYLKSMDVNKFLDKVHQT